MINSWKQFLNENLSNNKSEKVDIIFNKSYNLKYIDLKYPFHIKINNIDCVNDIKTKYNNIEIIEHTNPRVIHKITYDIIIENWTNVSELKNILIDCLDHLVEYGFVGKGQIDVYRRRGNS